MKTVLKKLILIMFIFLVANQQLRGAMVNRAATSAAAYLRSLGQSTRRYFGFQSQIPRSAIASPAIYSQRSTPLMNIPTTRAPSFANAVHTAFSPDASMATMMPSANAMVRSFSTSRTSYAHADEMKKFVEELLAGKQIGGELEKTVDQWITGKMDEEMRKIQNEALSTLWTWVLRGRSNVSSDTLKEAISDANDTIASLRKKMKDIQKVDDAIALWYAENTNSFIKMIDLRSLRSRLFARSIRSLIEENMQKAKKTIEGLEELKQGAAKILQDRGESGDWTKNKQQQEKPDEARVKEALRTLGMGPQLMDSLPKADLLKLAKRKRNNLMMQYHPDTLRGQGKSEKEILEATRKSKEINVAFDTIERWAEK